jgi:hypothetical protein
MEIKQTLAAIQDQTNVEDGVSVLLKSVHAQIKQVFTGVILPTEIKSKVDDVFDSYEAEKQKVADVLLAKTAYTTPKASPEPQPETEPTPEQVQPEPESPPSSEAPIPETQVAETPTPQ